MSPIRCGQILQRLACDKACDLLRAIEHWEANAEKVVIGKSLLRVCGQCDGFVPREFPKRPHCGLICPMQHDRHMAQKKPLGRAGGFQEVHQTESPETKVPRRPDTIPRHKSGKGGTKFNVPGWG